MIKHTKSSSSPSPIDQVSYHVLKRCPSLLPALSSLYYAWWESASIPSMWKQGVIRLIPKQAAMTKPEEPGNFRPIALTSCIGKVFTLILKNRWMEFMLSNGYLNTNVQKAFMRNIHGCTWVQWSPQNPGPLTPWRLTGWPSICGYFQFGDAIIQYQHMGYNFSQSSRSTNILQYADDTCLIADRPSSCQNLLNGVERWLQWTGMKAKVPKCHSLAIQSSSGKTYDPAWCCRESTFLPLETMLSSSLERSIDRLRFYSTTLVQSINLF